MGNERCFSGTEVGFFFFYSLFLRYLLDFFCCLVVFLGKLVLFFHCKARGRDGFVFWLLDYTFIRAQIMDGVDLVDGRVGANTWAFSSFSFFLSFCNSVLWFWRMRIRFFVHCSFSFSVVSC